MAGMSRLSFAVMDEYSSNATVERVAERLGEADSVLITTHSKPDGDALGSLVALGRALQVLGKMVDRRVLPPVPPGLKFLAGDAPLTIHEGEVAKHVPEPDVVVVVDTGAWSQLGGLRQWLEPRREKAVVIDHHLHGDDVGALRLIDAEAAAASEPVAAVVDALGVGFDATIRDALFVGIASDTGWFRFSNTRPNTHRLAARLQELGVDHAGLYRRLEQAERPEKLALLRRALNNLELVADGRAAVITLRESDFAASGAREDETERLIDIPQMVGDVAVAALLVENGGGTRMSLRSKPGPSAPDVNELARRFGGGGHARAAGAKTEAGMETVFPQLVDAVREVLGIEEPSASS